MTTYQTTTTLARIRAAEPCRDGWAKLLAHLGKTAADDEPLELLTVLESNGRDDALWVIDNVLSGDRLFRHLQAAFAEPVLPLFEAARPNDSRIRNQIDMLRNDEATTEEREAASDAAWHAARAVIGCAAWYAAKAADGVYIWGAADAAAKAVADADFANYSAAHASARAAQERQLRKMLEGEA